ncbi:MAG: flagellar motor protein MotD [Rugosibacter sp.]|nr:flagellar motor protein MotD [Rugosibacter sp.]
MAHYRRRRRRRSTDENENHERWLVSYADFITLLFAFFVVMYAISSVNEGKYRVMSESIVSAFRSDTTEPSGDIVAIRPGTLPKVTSRIQLTPEQLKAEALRRAKEERFRDLTQELKKTLAPLMIEGKVRMVEGAFGITLNINASTLFLPGEARLSGEATRTLEEIGRDLAASDFAIRVEGHTDNVPITGAQFPSNWELSSARAASVVRLFIDADVDPRRLTATGFADQRPLDDNASQEGKQKNRRVAITIEAPKL